MQNGVPICVTLEEIGYLQNATRIVVDKSTCYGFVNNTIKQKRSKAIDINHSWLQDRKKEDDFFVLWSPGGKNEADCVIKHHKPSHHLLKRHVYVHVEHVANSLTCTIMQGVTILRFRCSTNSRDSHILNTMYV